MEGEQKKAFMEVCGYFCLLADKLKEVAKAYRLEVMLDWKMLEKRRKSMAGVVLRTIMNLVRESDILVESLGKEQLKEIENYNDLLEYINIYKKSLNKLPAVELEDKSVQTDLTEFKIADKEVASAANDITIRFGVTDESDHVVNLTVKEEQLSGCESEETVLIERDVNLNDVESDENEKDLQCQDNSPTECNSACSTEGGSFIFNFKCDDQSTSKDGHSKTRKENDENISNDENVVRLGDKLPTQSGISNPETADELGQIDSNRARVTNDAETGANLEELKEDDDNSIFEKCTQAVQPDTEIDTGTNLQEEECANSQQSQSIFEKCTQAVQFDAGTTAEVNLQEPKCATSQENTFQDEGIFEKCTQAIQSVVGGDKEINLQQEKCATLQENTFQDESIFEKCTQAIQAIVGGGMENHSPERECPITKVVQAPPAQITDENLHGQLLQLQVEHESDFEEDDDYYQLMNDDMRDSDFKSSSLSDCEQDTDSSKSDVFSEKDDSESSSETPTNTFAEFKSRKCVVNIKRLSQDLINKYCSKAKNISDSESESDKMESAENHQEDPFVRLAKEVERLTDFSTLKLSTKRNKKFKSVKEIKRRKTENGAIKTQQSDDDSSSTFSDISSDSGSSVKEIESSPLQKPFDIEDLQYEILKNLSGISDTESDECDELYSETDSESETESNKKENKTKTDSDAESRSKINIEKRKGAEWRKDKLLRGKILSSSESDSDSDVPKSSARKRKKRTIYSEPEETDNIRVLEKEEIKLEKDIKVEKNIKVENKEDGDETKSVFTNSTPLYEVTDILSPSPESNSDVEFVSPTNQKKTDLYINNDQENNSSSDVEFVEDDGKRGRKNIRKVLDDVNLGEETKKANKEEEAHRHRLLKKKKELESWSQSLESSQVQGLVLDLNETTKQAIITVDPALTARLKQHQVAGVRFMWDICYESVERLKESPGTGCILAHCMGLGKTYQVIVLIHTLFRYSLTNTNYVLVVCPLSTVLNWVNEFEYGLKNVSDKVNVFYLRKQSSDKLKMLIRWRKKRGVLIMGYEAYERMVRSEDKEIIEALVDPGPDLIVCDEGHLIKNEKAIRSQALNRVKTRRRIMLTGTPIQNNLKEYYYMVNFVKPNLLGTYKEYCNRFANPITNGQYHDSTLHDIKIMKKRSHVLHKLLRSTVQRYEVSELEKQIPKKLDHVIFIKSHPIQADLYKQYLESIHEGEIKRIFGHFFRLQAILSHPYVLDLKEKHDTSSKKNEQKEVEVINLEPEIKVNEPLPIGWWRNFCPEDYRDNLDYGPKFKVMLKIVDECQKIGDKILIFSNSMPEMDAIEYNLKKCTTENRYWKKGVDYYRMDGTVPPEERNSICDSFNNPNNTKAKVFLISYRVGGLGLNMVAANRVILMDVNWNPSYETQSIFRIYRFGQVKECFVYRLVAMGTIEEVIYQRSVTKLSIAGRVVDERQITRHYKSSELQQMLRFNLNLEEARPIPKPPNDKLLAKLLLEMETEIFKYHEHQALLENRPDEELNEEEMKLAWEEYHQEQIKEKEPATLANVHVNTFDQITGITETSTIINGSTSLVTQNNRIGPVTATYPSNFSVQQHTENNPSTPASDTLRKGARHVLLLKGAPSQLNSPRAVIVSNSTKNILLSKKYMPSKKSTPNRLKSNQSKNTVIKPFLPTSQPSTSSGSAPQFGKTWIPPKDLVILNNWTNSPQNNVVNERNPTQIDSSQNLTNTEQQKEHTEMVQALKHAVHRFYSNSKNQKTVPSRKTAVVTPRIQSVFSEAKNNDSNNQDEVIDVDRVDIMKLISNNSSISLLPKAGDKDQVGAGKVSVEVIEIP